MNGLKKRVSVFVVCIMVLVLSVPICAATLPTAMEKDGDTYVGTFRMADQTDLYKQFWDDWKHSDRNVMLAGAGGEFFWFLIVPEGASLAFFDDSSNSPDFIRMTCNKAIDYLRFSVNVSDSESIEVEEMGTLSAGTPLTTIRYVVSGTYFNTVQYHFSNFSYDYLVDYEGILYLVDDLDGDQDEDSGLLAWLKNIWDWLSSFWEKLKALLLSLFVPSDGYFSDWFAEIRAAFENKLGGLGAVFDSIKDAFDSISAKDFSLTVTLKPNSLFPGFQGLSVDVLYFAQPFLNVLRPVLTGLVLIITAVTCYKRLAAFTRT